MAMRPLDRRSGSGFTLVELLVVITIIGILVALLLPAVQGAREAARAATCKSRLKQLGIAAQHHVARHGHFPTGGWGWFYVGDPDRGFDKEQPGGWTYNVLPFIEQEDLWRLPADGQPETVTPQQRDGALKMVRTPLLVMNCPTRRSSILFTNTQQGTFVAYNCAEVPTRPDNYAARGDYAICCGNTGRVEWWGGPRIAHSGTATMPSYGYWHVNRSVHSGMCFEGSEVRPAHVTDGLAFTILIGERYIRPAGYNVTLAPSNNENIYTGMNNDRYRSTVNTPRMDRDGMHNQSWFGAAHPSGCHFVFCDGSVKKISYNVDAATFKGLGTRAGGENLDLTQF